MRPSSVKPRRNCSTPPRRLENLDDYLARETYLEALAAIMYAGRLGEPGALADAAEAARDAVGRMPKLPRPIDLLLSGMAERITGGVSAGSGPLRVALEVMCELGAVKRDPGPALDGARLPDPAGIRRTRTVGRSDRAINWPRRRAAGARRRCTGRTSTSARLPGRGPLVGWRIRHGGNTYRRSELDNRGDRPPRACEVPLAVTLGLAGKSGRRGRA